jgi:hypothetical protein
VLPLRVARRRLSLHELLDALLEPCLQPLGRLVRGQSSLLVGVDEKVAQPEHAWDLSAQGVADARRQAVCAREPRRRRPDHRGPILSRTLHRLRLRNVCEPHDGHR